MSKQLIKPGWSVPSCKCEECGEQMKHVAYIDGDGSVGFLWDCCVTNDIADGNPLPKIEWPVAGDFLSINTMKSLGFEVEW